VLTPWQRVFGHPVLSIVIAACVTHFFQPFGPYTCTVRIIQMNLFGAARVV
jgi:hypothetical protein